MAAVVGRARQFEYDGSYLPCLLATTVLNIIMFVVNPRIMETLFPQIKTVSAPEKLGFNLKVVTLCNLAVVCLMCLYVHFSVTELELDPIWFNSSVARTSAAIFSGHLVADIVIRLVFYKELGDLLFLGHHLMALIPYHYVVVYGVLTYYGNLRLIGEFSSPFLILRSLLETLGLKGSHPAYLINGILLTISFFIFRILAMPIFWPRYFSVFGTKDFMLLGHLQYSLTLCCFVIDCMNVYWFYRICKGLYKVLNSKSHSS